MAKEATRSRKRRILEEMRRLMTIVAYLFVLLMIFQLYRGLILRQYDIHYNYTQGLIFALINAWVLGKFVLLGDSIYRDQDWPLVYLVMLKSGICGIMLLLCSILEATLSRMWSAKSFAFSVTSLSAATLIDSL